MLTLERTFPAKKIFTIVLFIASILGCNQKVSPTAESNNASTSEEVDAEKPGVTTSDGANLVLAGQLTLGTGLRLHEETSRKILYFALLGGSVMEAPVAVDVDENGVFSVEVSAVNTTIKAAKEALAQSPIAKDPLKEAFPEHADEIAKMTDAQIKSALQELVDEVDAKGGPQYVLVSYVPSGNLAAEAESFSFVGLPYGNSNVMVFPGDSLKGNLSFGKITVDDGDESKAELQAGTDVFSLNENSIAQLASLGQTLKAVKNYWINKTDDGKSVKFDSQPFFAWSAKMSALSATKFSAPAALKYTGYGMYIKANKFTSATFEQLCPASGSFASPATPVKMLTLTPPESIERKLFNNDGSVSFQQTFDGDNPMNNDEASRSDQNGKSVCNGNATGFYGRDDSDEGDVGDFMFNWGTGGSLQGPVPKGLWTLALDSSVKAQFDLSSSFPLDSDSNPVVLVPVAKLSFDDNDNVTGVGVKFMIFDRSQSAFIDVDDLALFKKMASEISVGFSVGNGNGNDDRYGVIGRDDEDFTITYSDTGINAVPKAEYKLPIGTEWGEANKISGVFVSYQIGSANYRFTFMGQ